MSNLDNLDQFKLKMQGIPSKFDSVNNMDGELTRSFVTTITSLELAIINQYLYDSFANGGEIDVISYGHLGNNNRIIFGGLFDHTGGWWFKVNVEGLETPVIIQTLSYTDSYEVVHTKVNITSDDYMTKDSYTDMADNLKKIAFNKSRFKGKCIEVTISGGKFRGITEVEIKDVCDNIVLNRSQRRLIQHLVNRIKRGKTARVMFNGVPGAGKTETIRQIIQDLTPQSTFIIPIFNSVSDLKMILETCEIFDSGVVIMDDVDLFIGNRERGNVGILGEFLSFFDGVQKRKISLLASTNDKGLVDEAAERPGRFNFIVDFDYLDEGQVTEVCKIHLDEKWQVDEVYQKLTGKIDGKDVKITGAFIHNLGENLKEMVLDYEDEELTWELEDTLTLIESFYKGFYGNQTKKEKTSLGFGRG